MKKNKQLAFQAGALGHLPWDPKASLNVQVNFNAAVFTKPIYVDSSYRLSPGLIKTWYWDYKNNSFTFEVDSKVIFSDGSLLEPKDLEFALLKSFLSQKGEYKRGYFYDIKGIGELRVGQTFVSGMCDGVKLIGNNKVRVFLNKPNPNFIYVLYEGLPPVAPVDSFKGDYFSFKGLPPSSGLYTVTSRDPEKGLVVLIKNKKYLSSPGPSKILFYTKGSSLDNRIDLAVDAGGWELSEDKSYKQVTGKIPKSLHVISFNYQNSYGKNKLFREILSLSLERKKIVAGYPQSLPSHELIPSMYLGRSGTKFRFDLKLAKKKAKQLLSSSQISVKAIYHGKNGSKELPQYIKTLRKQFERVGVNVAFMPREFVRFSDDKSVAFRVVGKGTLFTDPLSVFAPYIYKGIADKEYADKKDIHGQKLFRSAKFESDKKKQAKLLTELTKHYQREFLVIPLQENKPTFYLGPRIKTIEASEIFSSIDFSKVEFLLLRI